jgi:hypothetical protein
MRHIDIFKTYTTDELREINTEGAIDLIAMFEEDLQEANSLMQRVISSTPDINSLSPEEALSEFKLMGDFYIKAKNLAANNQYIQPASAGLCAMRLKARPTETFADANVVSKLRELAELSENAIKGLFVEIESRLQAICVVAGLDFSDLKRKALSRQSSCHDCSKPLPFDNTPHFSLTNTNREQGRKSQKSSKKKTFLNF